MTSSFYDDEEYCTREYSFNFAELFQSIGEGESGLWDPASEFPFNVLPEHDYKNPEMLSEHDAPAITSFVSQPLQPSAELSKEDLAAGKPFRGFNGPVSGCKPPKIPHKDKISGGREKRLRSPDWSAEEKSAYLELKAEALSKVKGKHWDFISQGLQDRHKFERSAKCCEDLWGTLRKAYRDILTHEELQNNPQRSNWISYWEMDGIERSRNKLPKSFSLEWCKIIKRILVAQKNRSGKKSIGVPEEISLGDEDDSQAFYYRHLLDPFQHWPSDLEFQGEQPRNVSDYVLQTEMPNLKLARRMEREAITEDAQIKQHVQDVVNSALGRLGSRISEDDDPRITLISAHMQRALEAIYKSALQRLVVRIDEDDLMTTLAPFKLKSWMDDAVKSSFQPITFGLEAVRNQKQEYQTKLQAITEKRRALDLEEKEIKRQRRNGRQNQRTRRVFRSSKGFA